MCGNIIHTCMLVKDMYMSRTGNLVHYCLVQGLGHKTCHGLGHGLAC